MEEDLDFEMAFYEKLLKRDPHFVWALIPLGEAYTKKGLHEKALEIDRRLAELRREDPVVYYNLACSLALLGKEAEAFEALERSLQLGFDDLEHLQEDPDLKELRQDPRFQSLLLRFQKASEDPAD